MPFRLDRYIYIYTYVYKVRCPLDSLHYLVYWYIYVHKIRCTLDSFHYAPEEASARSLQPDVLSFNGALGAVAPRPRGPAWELPKVLFKRNRV